MITAVDAKSGSIPLKPCCSAAIPCSVALSIFRIFPLAALVAEVSRINNGVFDFQDVFRRYPSLYAAHMLPDESFKRGLCDHFVEQWTFELRLLLSCLNACPRLIVAFLLRAYQRF